MESTTERSTTRLAESYGDCIFDEPATTVYLTGCSTPDSRDAGRHNLGLLIQPGNSYHLQAADYGLVGVDNGCYAQGDKFDAAKWLQWLRDKVAQIPNVVFVTCPDVVHRLPDGSVIGDAAATLDRSAPFFPLVRELGLPAALVAQDGLELLDVPWDDFDALFIGGSDDWKLGPHAAELAAEARRRGLWVHMGRVNSWKRIAIARAALCDSVDGTFLQFDKTTNWPRLAAWLDRLDTEAAELDELAAA